MINRNRKLVQRDHAEQYLLLTLISFAASVSITRLGLFLTDYPKLGNSELHIAHVLWGGLLLFAACLLMLVFANRQIRILGAILSGIGVGLFIDEVGKFITQSNDYFYPAAAPIIYAFFLLTFLLFIAFRKKKKLSSREELYHIAQQLEEILDHDLTTWEQNEMRKKLENVIHQSGEQELKNLAESLLSYLVENSLQVSTNRESILQRVSKTWTNIEKKVFTRKMMRIVLGLSLIGLAVWVALTPLTLLFQDSALVTLPSIRNMVDESILNLITDPLLLNILIVTDVVLGGLLILGAFATLIGKDGFGTLLAQIDLLVLITIVNLFVFYFDQFSSIAIASVEFLLLFIVLRYRNRFCKKDGAGEAAK